MDQEETIFTPVPWDRTAMKWRRLVCSPFCELTATQKLILITTCLFGKKWGEDIFPSQRAIAYRAGVSVTYVNTTMKLAEKRGWIIRYMFPMGTNRCHTVYNLSIPAGVQDAAAFVTKARFWLPPYKYELERDEHTVKLVKRSSGCST